MRKKTLFTVLTFAVLLLLAACSNNNDNAHNADENQAENDTEETANNTDSKKEITQVSSYDKKSIQDQESRDQEITEVYSEGNYTLQDPFVKVNPYKVSLLSALVKFETDEPTEIEVIVGGNDNEAAITNQVDGFETSHDIPILGLYADTENMVTLKATDQEGNVERTEVSIQTDALPADFPTIELDTSNPQEMEDGLTFITPGSDYLYAVDENADVRWLLHMDLRLILSRMENGNILVNTRDESSNQMPEDEEENEKQYDKLLEMNLLGKIDNAYTIHLEDYPKGNLLHHEVIELPNGNLLATTHDPDSKYVEDNVHEIDRGTGKTVEEIDIKDLFPAEAYEDYDGEYADDYDWFHQNAIFYDDTDDSILVSSRHQDAIMKLSYPEAEVQWILAADEGWDEDNQKHLLEPKNENVKFPAAQHAVKALPDMDDNPDTLDILLFDNNHVVIRGDKDIGDQYSRAVQYRIDEQENTVEEVWSYGEERGEDFYSEIIGNAQYLPDTGNRLITSGYIDPEPESDDRISKVVETNDNNEADVIYEITLSGFKKTGSRFIYRAVRMPLYP